MTRLSQKLYEHLTVQIPCSVFEDNLFERSSSNEIAKFGHLERPLFCNLCCSVIVMFLLLATVYDGQGTSRRQVLLWRKWLTPEVAGSIVRGQNTMYDVFIQM